MNESCIIVKLNINYCWVYLFFRKKRKRIIAKIFSIFYVFHHTLSITVICFGMSNDTNSSRCNKHGVWLRRLNNNKNDNQYNK